MIIKLLATSDVHGAISPYKYSDNSLAQQGLARLSAHIDQLRDKNTLLIDNGDALEGNPMNFYHIAYEKNTVHPMATALNYLKYDYFNLGNHDFNYGYAIQHRYINDLNAKCITGNVLEDGKTIGAEYTIHRFDDSHSIAIIGITTQYIPNWEKPENIARNTFINAFDFVRYTVAKIQEKETVNGIVVVYHGGFECDMDTGKPTETLTGENLAYKICSEIDGVDVIISGHQHRSIAQKCCGKTVTQTAFNGMQLAVIEWDLDTNTSECYLLNADAPIDIDLMDAIAEKETRVQKWLDQPLGTIKSGPLLIDDLFQARLHKHPVVSFLARVMMDISGAQLSANALFNDSKGFSSQITMRDLVSTYVYPNTTVVLKITGLLLKQFLEKCAEYFDVVNDSITVSKDFVFPKPKHYNYDMITGVEYTINASLPVGQRIVSLTYQGNTVQDTDEFTLAMTNYRASGGGNFDMVKECEIIKEIQTDFVECIAQYLKNHPDLELEHTENIKVIK